MVVLATMSCSFKTRIAFSGLQVDDKLEQSKELY